MGERKVLNKYFPPDFDPSKLPRGKRVRTEDRQMKVRMMLPMSVRCNTCGNFMYKGTKFNTRMEDVKGDNYLGIKLYRFYYKCTNCAAEFCMKTDPQTADYVVEAGATRNYELRKDLERSEAQDIANREEEEKGNAMKALENRTLDSKREMDILTALDEMKSLKARHETVNTEAALAALKRAAAGEEPVDLDAEDEEAVRQMLLQRAQFVKRLSDSDHDDDDGGEEEEELKTKKEEKIENRPAKRSRAMNLGPSVAAAAWDEEEEEEEAEKRDDDIGSGGINNNNRDETATTTNNGEKSKKNNANELNKAGGKSATAILAPPPSSVPSFAARPAVVVKPKINIVSKKPSAAATKDRKKDDEEDGVCLAGLLGGYGSSDSD